MGAIPGFAAGLLIVSLGIMAFGQSAPPAPQPASSGSQRPPSAEAAKQKALEPLLEEADEDRNITYMDSTLSFEYRHEAMDGGVTWDNFELQWQQSFGRSQRFAAGILLPFIRSIEGQDQPSASGIGDIQLGLKGILGKGEKFEHAAGIELTVPSASRDVIGNGATVLRFAWGCSAQLTERTLLNAELGYNKPVQNSHSINAPGTNSIEPELIVTQGFTKRFAGYLDWDSYYDFSANDYVSLMRTGFEFTLDRRERWTVNPYETFALTHAARLLEVKDAAGVILAYRY